MLWGVFDVLPIEIYGRWDKGIVMDKYKKSCTYLGDDQNGYPQFSNEYTQLGHLIYSMKYNGHDDTSDQIAHLIADDVRKWIETVDINVLVSVTPSVDRTFQPVFQIVESLAHELKLPFSNNVLVKTDHSSVKNIEKERRNLSGLIAQKIAAKRHCNVLLVDDFYSTGSTANECVSVLKSDQSVDKVYFLAMVKTK